MIKIENLNKEYITPYYNQKATILLLLGSRYYEELGLDYKSLKIVYDGSYDDLYLTDRYISHKITLLICSSGIVRIRTNNENYVYCDEYEKSTDFLKAVDNPGIFEDGDTELFKNFTDTELAFYKLITEKGNQIAKIMQVQF